MRKALLSAFLVIYNLTGIAQSNFNNLYDYNLEAQFGVGVIIISDSTYLISSISNNYDSLYQRILFANVAPSGNLLSINYEYDSATYYFLELSGSLHQIDDLSYYSSGTAINNISNGCNSILVFYNLNADSLQMIKYSSFTCEIVYHSCYTSDGRFLMVGGNGNNMSDLPDFFLTKIDTDLNLMWKKTYESSGYDIALKVFESENNSYIVSGIKNLTSQSETTWIIKLDTSGNIIAQKEFNFEPYKCTDGRFTFLNENYLMCGCLDTVYNISDDPHPVYVAKLDTNFNVVWRSDFHGPEIRAISLVKQLPDSTIVFIGEKFNLAEIPLGWIVKLDKNGNTLWERTYFKSQTIDNYFADFQQTYDKGFIVTGSAFGPTQDVWLVKLDSMGCLDPNDCTFNTGTIEVGQELTSLSVFPNPAASQITLLYNLPISATDAVISFYDITGRLIHQVQPNPP
ncbi:MAG TPA: hypothetical protein PLD02_16585, partial [Saprospiraceae bacterium]|nr:hypothetical protein [Saprospiraceae bacterium]